LQQSHYQLLLPVQLPLWLQQHLQSVHVLLVLILLLLHYSATQGAE
jgi:hypothetical protein